MQRDKSGKFIPTPNGLSKKTIGCKFAPDIIELLEKKPDKSRYIRELVYKDLYESGELERSRYEELISQ
ncbi:hypothetical protein F7734_49165 [Scytonema sp. UIC 10036]|uniref:hypothetical protein n=1 Tax=Scytonema sp. UIC 10036 TaxID=2304196 RepID=UPI0012DA57D2|nr:hypothetical protein [Scytonema sp. UIC 10036]MUG99826.1 hypothetical protein [Scytonema sp. UIC 10036]